MSPRKLSDGDRQEILSLYRNTNETTSTLAMRFGVSSSTISRFLKNSLTENEYEDLIQEKRLARTSKNDEEDDVIYTSSSTTGEEKSSSIPERQKEQLNLNFDDIRESLVTENIITQNKITENHIPEKIVTNEPETECDRLLERNEQEIIKPMDQELQETSINETELQSQDSDETITEMEDDDVLESVKVLAAMYGEDMEDDIDDDEEDIDDDEEDIDDDEEDIDDDEMDEELIASSCPRVNQLQVLPFDTATFPRICYLVIDRNAELVTKPLKDFAHIGNIPTSETFQLTLPIFDNHKIAKRYCDAKGALRSRKPKVIKVPDGKLLQKTANHLKAKGITRVLMDGKIYSLN